MTAGREQFLQGTEQQSIQKAMHTLSLRNSNNLMNTNQYLFLK